MEVVGHFEKVSLKEFTASIKLLFDNQWDEIEIAEMWDAIKLPKRGTRGSAGYDFFAPFYFYLPSWGDITIPTGIKAVIKEGWYLQIAPRSGHGTKHYLRLATTIGVVDSDYHGNPSNEGHIMAKLRKESGPRDTSTPSSEIEFKQGDAFCQGIFIPFGITEDDNAAEKRTGGFGSTGN